MATPIFDALCLEFANTARRLSRSGEHARVRADDSRPGPQVPPEDDQDPPGRHAALVV